MSKRVVLILVMLSLIAAGLPAEEKKENKDSHQVFVDMMLVPIFAVNADGSPVFDLQKEELELYANGKPMDIDQFMKFDFQLQKEATVKNKKVDVKQPSRAVFIIVDSVFNGFFSFRRTKKVAIDIVKKGSPGDIFIVLENRAGGGLRYLAGPRDYKKDIIGKINKLKLPSGNWSKNLHLTREYDYNADQDSMNPVHASNGLANLYKKGKNADRMDYKNRAIYFAKFLAKFKYALKTVTRPKVVFLISEGIAKAAFKNSNLPTSCDTGTTSKASPERSCNQGTGNFASAFNKTEARVSENNQSWDMRLFRDLQKTVQAINEGGGVLYTINPGKFKRDHEASGEMSLKYLAHESGGKYIGGSDTKKLVKNVINNTSAYYELAFSTGPDMGKNIAIQVKCKRKGVEINTFKRTEKAKPYYRMEPVEKKLFALNMVTGGSWSRLMGKVVRIKYNKLREERNSGKSTQMIEIVLPEKMKGRTLDMFAINIDPKTKKVNIDMISRKVKNRANLIVNTRKDTNEFFVLIEPLFAYCIYNQV
ncbi:MAG: hypothetical protein GY765_07955 [bacterium]|nr:hypothetical protein [bacterium]